ncbi:hypothetical protein [Flindersiella endophytica]
MTDRRSLLDALHEATHRLPGVPAHVNQPAGHHGDTHHDRPAHTSTTERHRTARTWNHSRARAPRVLVAWQRRIATFFGQELS